MDHMTAQIVEHEKALDVRSVLVNGEIRKSIGYPVYFITQ